jgi:hypothetical protein
MYEMGFAPRDENSIMEHAMRTLTILAAITACGLFAGSAESKVKLKEACGQDLEKYCKDVKKGEGRKACLRTHAAELQPSCVEELKTRDAGKAAKKAQ